MRGHYEESSEVKAKMALQRAARQYASAYLADMFGPASTEAEALLQAAALEYAAVTSPRTQGGYNAPRRDRTGEEHPTFVILGQGTREGDLLTWRCRCRACGKEFSMQSRHVTTKIRGRATCGCRVGERFRKR